MQIDSLDHVVLTVTDLEKTCDFYVRVLGMQRITFGKGRTALAFGRQKLNLQIAGQEVDPKAAFPKPGSADLCFLTSTPIEEVRRHLEACGVPIEMGPIQRAGGIGPILSVYVRDPDGNLVEVSNVLESA